MHPTGSFTAMESEDREPLEAGTSGYRPAIQSSLQHLKLLGFVVFVNFFLTYVWGVLYDSIRISALVLPRHLSRLRFGYLLHGNQGDDSLGAMLPAIHLLKSNPRALVYQTIFFDQHIKFQYPLSSLIPYYLLAKHGYSDDALSKLSLLATASSYLAVVLVCMALALRLSRPAAGKARPPAEGIAVTLSIGIASLFFMPLFGSYLIGQIQVVLTLGFCVAFYCWTTQRYTASGILMGLMTLVKPQYGLFLVWALLRKKYNAAVSGIACAVSGTLLSCVYFGLQNNLDYLRVLREISSRGEGFLANQSANGLLNRLLFNGPNLKWEANSFAPHNTVVYVGTLVTTVGFLALAIFFPWGRLRRGGVADFATIVLVATLASPVAWSHHYGIVLPMLIWLWYTDYSKRPSKASTLFIAMAYILVCSDITPTEYLATVPVLNILQSYGYFGAIMTLWLLLRCRGESSPLPAAHSAKHEPPSRASPGSAP